MTTTHLHAPPLTPPPPSFITHHHHHLSSSHSADAGPRPPIHSGSHRRENLATLETRKPRATSSASFNAVVVFNVAFGNSSADIVSNRRGGGGWGHGSGDGCCCCSPRCPPSSFSHHHHHHHRWPQPVDDDAQQPPQPVCPAASARALHQPPLLNHWNWIQRPQGR